jgi:lysophospholipase L1-like esterase
MVDIDRFALIQSVNVMNIGERGTEMPCQRFVALGDSCTEGIDDPYPGAGPVRPYRGTGRCDHDHHARSYRGWADLVATRLAAVEPGLRYANLGVRGRRLDQIFAEQFPVAAALAPDVVALFGGGNDLLSPAFHPDAVTGTVWAAVRALTAMAPTAVVFTISDMSGRAPLIRGLRRRIVALNAAYRAAAESYGAVLVDLWPDDAVRDLRYFGPDRLHLSDLGHRRLAAHMLERLDVPFDQSWLDPLPGVPQRLGLREHASWVRHEVVPVALTRLHNRMVGRSPGDGCRPKRPMLSPIGQDFAIAGDAVEFDN